MLLISWEGFVIVIVTVLWGGGGGGGGESMEGFGFTCH